MRPTTLVLLMPLLGCASSNARQQAKVGNDGSIDQCVSASGAAASVAVQPGVASPDTPAAQASGTGGLANASRTVAAGDGSSVTQTTIAGGGCPPGTVRRVQSTALAGGPP